ncbi:MAG: D-2-hydroxyacid dehydrogenase [Ruminococcaceae bacterium]|nr:D-2-hydroxyacid dehydrogenase [Oscillospiraceae bacterium]
MKIVSLDRITLTHDNDIDFSPLTDLGEVTFFHEVLPPEQVADAVCDADVLLCNKALVTKELMDRCPNLKYVGIFATGYNNVDTAYAREKGITVCNAPGYSTPSVAQHVFALLLNHVCSIRPYAAYTASGGWSRSTFFTCLDFPITELSGKTLGIYGFGTIAREVAKIADAFGMKVIFTSRSRKDDVPYEQVEQDELFARSDFLTFHCPLTEETRGIINSESIAKMKKSVYLINTARGPLVREQELADALNEGRIAGAALDVLDIEPMTKDNPLRTAKNVTITPHTAWASREARQRLINTVGESLKAFLEGKPINVVNERE